MSEDHRGRWYVMWENWKAERQARAERLAKAKGPWKSEAERTLAYYYANRDEINRRRRELRAQRIAALKAKKPYPAAQRPKRSKLPPPTIEEVRTVAKFVRTLGIGKAEARRLYHETEQKRLAAAGNKNKQPELV